MTAQPPRWARALLDRFAPPDDREFIVGDLDDEFHHRAGSIGRWRASWWYTWQVTLSLPALMRAPRTYAERQRRIPPPMFSGLRSDIGDAIRRARRAPLSAATVVLISALGIGASTAVYSVVHGVLLAPLPFPGSERVVRIENRQPLLANESSYLPSDNWVEFLSWRERAKSYEVFAGLWEGGTTRAFTLADETSSFPVAIVTERFDQLLGVRPLLGRSLQSEDFAVEGSRVIALTERFWLTRFGGDSSIVGRVITVADTMRVVIGVLSDANDYPGPVAAWIPLAPVPGTSVARGRTQMLALFGRLRPGTTPEQARSEMQSLIGETSQSELQKSRVARVIPLSEVLTGSVRPVLLLLSAVVGVTLLVAAGNIALLLLTQAESRTRELAIRLSLGSELPRLARKLVVESLMLAAAGGVLGIVIARWLTRMMIAFYPGRFVRAQDVNIGLPVVLLVAGITIVVGLAGAWPLLRRLRKADLVTGLREGAGGESPRAARVRGALVVGQLAFAVALVAGGGQLARTFVNLLRVNPGFDSRGVGYVNVSASPARYPDRNVLLGHLDRAEDVVRALPGVTSAASVSYLPLPSRVVGWGTQATRPDDVTSQEFAIQFRQMSPGYLSVMGIPLLRGRDLAATDDGSSEPVAIINETLAKAAFPSVDPMGHQIAVQTTAYRIVGIVGDMRYWGLGKPVVGEVFVTPVQSSALQFRSIVFKSSADLNAVIAAARPAIRAADPTLVISSAGTLADRVEAASAPERFRAMLVGSLALLAVVLAGLGLFAVSAHAVAKRVREIGIRMALGATQHRVRASVLRDTLMLGVSGTAIGLGLAWAGSQGLRAFVPDVAAFDVAMGGMVAALFLFVSLASAAVPASAASSVDPIVAIRRD